MKRIPFCCLSTFFLCSCAHTPAHELQRTVSKTYDNPEARVSLEYPSTWTLQREDTKDLTYKREVLRGPEGEVRIAWGNGFGGVCVDEHGEPKELEQLKLGSEMFQTCHATSASGTEMWAFIDKEFDMEHSFDISALVKAPLQKNREVILQILHSLKVKN